MKKIFLTVAVVLFSLPLFAYPHEKKPGITYLFGDKSNVRAKPSIAGAVVVNIPIGTKIQIIKRTDILFESDDLIDYWYKVKINKGHVGYIWGGLLSNNYFFCDIDNDKKDELILFRNFTFGGYSPLQDNNVNKLISEALYNKEIPGKTLLIRVVKNNRLLFSSSAFQGYGETRITDIKMVSISGFNKSPLRFIKITYFGESEIGGSGESYLFCGPRALTMSFNIFGGGEGGYYTEYRLIFPYDKGGQKNRLKAVVKEFEAGPDESRPLSTTVTDYRWDSRKNKFVEK